MKILLTGGGTGGHITPLLAVAHKLQDQAPGAELLYIGERGGKFTHLTKDHELFRATSYIFAGKFRRYNGESLLQRLLDVPTNLRNIRDIFFVIIGCFQAFVLLLIRRPDCIFVKGGFVGVPVGLAARLLRIPYITHDSDTVPGLANRIIGGGARLHATGMPAEFYAYPKDKVRFVGIPLADDYRRVDDRMRTQYRKQMDIPAKSQVVFVVGGSQGARNINEFMATVMPTLLKRFPDLIVLHQAGRGNLHIYDQIKEGKQRIRVFEFLHDLYRYSGAADLIVTRSGATNMAEFSLQHKACIVIPAAFLSGGHQLQNARHLAEVESALVLYEDDIERDSNVLFEAIERLLTDQKERQRLADNLGAMSKEHAATELARLILETVDA